MKKAYSYLIGISLSLLIAAFVITLASWNQIYVWLLGDVDMLYKRLSIIIRIDNLKKPFRCLKNWQK